MTAPDRKRAAPAEFEADQDPTLREAQRLRPNTAGPPRTATQEVWRALTSRHGLEMPQPQFEGLCGYLCALLRLGYRIHPQDLDKFIVLYPAFELELHERETRRILDDTVALPSYHQWFEEEKKRIERTEEPVLTEEKLRAIWAEIPYTFLRAQASLQVITELAEREQDRAL